MVVGMAYNEEGYRTMIVALERNYGSSEALYNAYCEKISNITPVKTWD